MLFRSVRRRCHLAILFPLALYYQYQNMAPFRVLIACAFSSALVRSSDCGDEVCRASDGTSLLQSTIGEVPKHMEEVEVKTSLLQESAQLEGVQPGVAPIAPFGREDTANELQNHAARTQDTLVDAVENAEVAEIKRAVFRSLTRLRAAEIKEFDTIARLETQALDDFNDNHHYRAENPLDYLHDDEPAVSSDKMTSFHD